MTDKRGKKAVRKAIQDAAPVTPPQAGVPEHVRRRFLMLETGLHKKGEGDALQWICSPFSIEAETLDEANRWGILISWADRDGKLREEIFARELFTGECSELRSRLASGGLTMMSDQNSRRNFADYLNSVETPARARCVSRTGWHTVGTSRVFVLPSSVIGKSAHRVILESSLRERPPFNHANTLAEWRDSVARMSIMNTRLVFAVSCAFAGPLLDLTGDDGGGFNLKGQSRVGKTTALRVAASVWGGENGIGAAAFIRAWRATGNALEGVAAIHSDTVLCLDEMGQVDAKEIGEISYMLANGQGKTRADRSGAMRAQARFRILFLSTGEVGLADKNAEGKKTTNAGMLVRFVDIAADAGAGFGIFEFLHHEGNADVFAESIRAATRQSFGTAGPAFIEFILDSIERDPEFVPRLNDRIDQIIYDWLKAYPDANGQVRSVAKRFALVAMAGTLATEGFITGWNGTEAIDACRRIFREWLAQRGTIGAREDAQAVIQLRDFINRHGDSRFKNWNAPTRLNEDQTGEGEPHERFRTVNSAGWRRWKNDSAGHGFWIYYLTREAIMEALSGLDFHPAIKVLVELGFVMKDSAGKSAVSIRPPGLEDNIRLYAVPSAIMGAGDNDKIEPE